MLSSSCSPRRRRNSDDSLRDRGLAIGRLLHNMQFYWPL